MSMTEEQKASAAAQESLINTAKYVPVISPEMSIDEIAEECLKKYGTTQTYWKTMEGDKLVIYFMMTMNFEGHKMKVFLQEVIGEGVIEPKVVQEMPADIEMISIEEYHSIIEWAGV